MPCHSVETPRAMTNSAAPFCSQPRSFGPILPNSKEAEQHRRQGAGAECQHQQAMPSMIEGAVVVALTAIAMVIEQGISRTCRGNGRCRECRP
jgi:hypothetical protein